MVFAQNLNLITQPREYFGPVTIQNLTIQLLDPYGRVLDLNNNDVYVFISFCLWVLVKRVLIDKTKNKISFRVD